MKESGAGDECKKSGEAATAERRIASGLAGTWTRGHYLTTPTLRKSTTPTPGNTTAKLFEDHECLPLYTTRHHYHEIITSASGQPRPTMLKTPPLQTATATIDTLSGRLQSATLLEDRRAAILGLRSFAKQYPASVASGSLRELISTLKRDGLGDASSTGSQDGDTRRSQDGGDVDTIRLILETLLMLFNPDSSSPEAGDEIALFLADEFSMVCF